MVEVNGTAWLGRRLAQLAGTRPLLASRSISVAWFMVITSAARPLATASACLLEPPCDCCRVTVSPVLAL